MSFPMRKGLSGLSLAALLVALPATADAADRGRRAAARTDTPRATARATPAAPRTQSSAPAESRRGTARVAPRGTAAGRATYGHGGYGAYGWYPGWHGYGYPWGYLDLYWGWPAWGPWVYAPPQYDLREPVVVYSERGPARFEIDVTPRNANVKLDGEDVGRAKDWDGRWDRLAVQPGERVLSFEAAGYKTLRIEVDAAPSGSYRVSYDLEKGEGIDARSTATDLTPPAPRAVHEGAAGHVADAPDQGLARGFLRVKATPADAAVYLDGAFFARADELARLRGAVPLAAGTHTIEIVRPGYGSRKVDVDVTPGRPSEVAVDLEPSR